jgi:hypothetical protein
MPPRYVQREVAKNLQFGFTDPTQIYLTLPQRCFIDFVEYCQKNKTNKFLPYFDDWSVHVRRTNRPNEDGDTDDKPLYYAYIQARTEALFPLKGKYSAWGEVYSHIGYWPNLSIQNIERGYFYTTQLAAISHLGNRKDLKKFIDTINELTEIAKTKGYQLDLHEGNFMFGSDGHVVINDPFYIRYVQSDSQSITSSD